MTATFSRRLALASAAVVPLGAGQSTSATALSDDALVRDVCAQMLQHLRHERRVDTEAFLQLRREFIDLPARTPGARAAKASVLVAMEIDFEEATEGDEDFSDIPCDIHAPLHSLLMDVIRAASEGKIPSYTLK
ncbi:hypothetical protein [Paracraurococcus lichenis]|uniref:Uncharacterized protein n=1 Tax=Paracraurococcus lichenis TaxID=3064888 RepID=A0ABT9EAU2_9PROT|nr:hypothetical protein [Paracraurococcus sp. LOR1-02]MDO9713319.1 hypothetical protein [Paracraurococcus sp. LOR1-02]